MVRRPILGVFYHLVSENPVPHARHLYPYRPSHIFEQDLDYLRRHFNLISYEELLIGRSGGKRLPPNAILLSFDDGFAECYHIVRPLLHKYRAPCVFFLATDFIDNRRMYYRNQVSLCIEQVMTFSPSLQVQALTEINQRLDLNLSGVAGFCGWIKTLTDEGLIAQICEILGVDIDAYLRLQKPYLTSDQIRQMAAEGYTIGAHSRRHQKLSRLDAGEIEAEISGSCQVIQELLGEQVIPFSFPNSATGIDRVLLREIKSRHPEIGLLFDTRGLRRDLEFIVNRIWVEAPAFNPQGETPFPQVMKQVYQNYVIEDVLRRRSVKA
jgi:peptidoglycan/xylan/chitin deacetylase (PgdA/CDA1 family)